MCKVLEVKSNNYYSFQKRNAKKVDDPDHVEIIEWIQEIAKFSGYSYGERRIKAALDALSFPMSRYKVAKLMKEADVWVRSKKKYKVTTNSDHKQPVFDNLLKREFDVAQPDQAYVADITYIWTQEGWLYLAVVIDLFSRKVVGWSIGSRMKAQLVCDALTMAIWQRRPNAGLIVHTDRGSQYASKVYRNLLKANKIKGSMSRKGDCWDNAVVERFFGSLKQERVQWKNYQTRFEAQQDILNYIAMFYNSHRLHSYLGYKSPNDYESEIMKLQKVA
ncbi:transposase [Thalassotalea sp. 42_200_T64]|nr:transposase [Thalassotalea sp. 42_200_T64]